MRRLHARFAGIAASLVLAVFSLTGPLAAPASAGYTYLCTGYKGCAAAGMPAYGYAEAGKNMYWLMYPGNNCTNYVAYRLVKNGMPNKRPWSGSGNAENWGLAMASITNQTPTVGSVAWWKQNVYPAGSVGHVAYVEKVISPTEIIVSQDFWGGDFSWARISKGERGWPNGFIHFNDSTLTNTAAPAVSGIAKVGETLTATRGTWSASDAVLAYQWLADGVPVVGATGTTFTPAPDQLGEVISVAVTASRSGYAATTATSAPTTPVARGDLTPEETPEVTGTPVVDETLVVDPGTFTPEPEVLRLQWKADGERIEGATTDTLQVSPELVGKTLTVTATARRAGYQRVRLSTAGTAPVEPGTLELLKPPSLAGAPRYGELLTLTPATVTPQADAGVEWLRGAEPVSGAAATSYQLGADDLGTKVLGRVTYTRPGYTPLTVVSNAVGRVKTVPDVRVELTAVDRRVKVVVSVTAPGVDAVPGVVRIRSGREIFAELPLVEGTAATTFRRLDAGRHAFTVKYPSTSRVTTGNAARSVRIG